MFFTFLLMRKVILLWLLIFAFSNSACWAQVNTESFRIKSDSSGFSVIADLELALMAGNTDFQHFGSNSRINYNWTKFQYTFLIINGGFGREDGKTFFSQALFHIRHVQTLTKFLQLEIFSQYDNNKSLLLLNRYLAGAGIRYRFLNKENIISRIGCSFFYEQEEYNLPANSLYEKQTNIIRFNSYLTFNFKIKEGLTFLSVTYLQPDVENIDDLRLLSNNALNIKLSDNLSLNIKLDGRYDSMPADGIKKYDLSSKMGLSIAF